MDGFSEVGPVIQAFRDLGLWEVMTFWCEWNDSSIHQLYETMVFDFEDETFLWITGKRRYVASSQIAFHLCISIFFPIDMQLLCFLNLISTRFLDRYTSTFHDFTTEINLDYDFMKTKVEPQSEASLELHEVARFYSQGSFVMHSRANLRRFHALITDLLRHTLSPKVATGARSRSTTTCCMT